MWRLTMRALTGLAVIILAVTSVTTADAKGCLKGAVVGGAAGHYAGHHGVLGAAAGCLIGRHQANKRARMENRDNRGNRSSQDYRRSPNEQRL
jgi:hypothetical protein